MLDECTIRFDVVADELIIILRGDLDVRTALAVEQAVTAHRPFDRCVVVDATDVGFVDSTGLRALIAILVATTEDTAQPAALRTGGDRVRHVLTTAGVATMFRHLA